ncbi:MAG: homoserine kinase [Longimicrobiales bacterium]
MTVLRRARVRVPCSTSNLGSGFDCLGLALDRHLTAEFWPGDAPLSVERTGTAARITLDRDHVYACFVAELDRLETAVPPGKLVIRSDIPLGRGLGSSASAVVAGLLLAHAVLGQSRVDPRALLPLAEEREGHPDNVAPALLGGLVAVARAQDGSAHPIRLPLSDEIGFAFAAPDLEVPTPLARRALPEHVPHGVAARALGRTAALLHGLALGDTSLLRIGFTDELHVPYRLPLIPGAQRAFAAARAAGAAAITISGSGSGLIAVCARGTEQVVAAAMAAALQIENPGETLALAMQPDATGASILLEDS